MTRRVLLVAFHFPPVQGSSGVLRTLSLTRYLPELGWEPVVLSAHPRAYPETSDHQLADVPEGTTVKRAFALDAGRHLALAGRYPGLLAAPDRWSSWWFGGVPAGLQLIRRWRPEVIWSTAPVATAHLIAMTLRRLSGLPWVADIRDLLTEPGDPEHASAWHFTRWIERRTLLTSDRTVVVSPGQRTEYSERFPGVRSSDIDVIPNGFDETVFRDAELIEPPPRPRDRVLLVHSGVLYPDGRDPEPFFRALASMIRKGLVRKDEIEVRLRASHSERRYAAVIERLDLTSTVKLMPGLQYRDAIAEMLNADGLLLFQGIGTGTAIPAKLYEYFRARRPILALTEPEGATATVLRQAGFTHLAPLESTDQVAEALQSFLQDLRRATGHILTLNETREYSRRRNCEHLATVLEEVHSGHRTN